MDIPFGPRRSRATARYGRTWKALTREAAAALGATIRLFDKFFFDPEQGGYYSHIDPILFSADH
ncbi:hypothetical protein, partial [Streptomyces sp. NPDC041003]|uniref:hypothetical protein n=1 Tax=Streptomyces sp. NPDC041003 TaxID=3155730 RepID=UPI0034003C9B